MFHVRLELEFNTSFSEQKNLEYIKQEENNSFMKLKKLYFFNISDMTASDVANFKIYLGAHDVTVASEPNRQVYKVSKIFYNKGFSMQTLVSLHTIIIHNILNSTISTLSTKSKWVVCNLELSDLFV